MTSLTPYKTVRIDRVQHMIEVFKKLPQRSIDLSVYCEIDKQSETVGEAQKNKCGTVACVAGHVVLEFAPKSWTLEWMFGRLQLVNHHGWPVTFGAVAASLLGLNGVLLDIGFFFTQRLNPNPNISQRAEALQRLRKLLRFAKKAQGVK